MEPASSNIYYINLLNTLTVYIYRYGSLAIYILGTIGNLLSIFIFLKRKWRKNACVFYFLTSLVLNLVFLNFTILATTANRGWNLNIRNSSLFICKVIFYVSFVTTTLIPAVLISASVDRLLISSQNIDTRLYSSRRLAYFLIGTSTIIWMLFNIHILVKVNIQQFGISVFACYYDLSVTYLNFVNYSLTVINCSFCLLMIVLSIFSFKNVRQIRAIPRRQRREVRSMTKKDFQLLRCLFLQAVVYISVSICSTFYSLHKVISRDQKRTPLQQAIVDFLDNLFTFIYFIFFCSGFFIFVCVSKAFRQEVKQLICKMVGKDLLALPREEEHGHEDLEKRKTELVVNDDVVRF